MELKHDYVPVQSIVHFVLIVPSGIETMKSLDIHVIMMVLIVPSGIET